MRFPRKTKTEARDSDVTVENQDGAIQRRRILGLSLGWILLVAALLLIIIGTLGAVLGTILPRKRTKLLTPIGSHSAQVTLQEVLSTNFPDPDLFEHNGTWFAFATNSAAGIVNSNMQLAGTGLGAANVQLATSTDLNNWTLHNPADDPLPTLGDWVANGTMKAEADPTVLVRRANVWAPDVLQRADGSFVLYYAAAAATVDPLHCVGAATSDELQGPYKPLSTPLACPTELGGAIDPASIIDADGTIYVAYKVDGNAKGNGGDCGNSIPPLHSTPILLQKMEKDGVTVSGTPTTILDRTDQDGPLVEAPGIIRSDDGVYFLFFSSGCTRLPSYDLKYATSQNIAGPYTRASEPLLKTGDMGLSAPGSASVRRNGSGWLMAFHARINTNVGGVRAMYIATLNLNGSIATLAAA